MSFNKNWIARNLLLILFSIFLVLIIIIVSVPTINQPVIKFFQQFGPSAEEIQEENQWVVGEKYQEKINAVGEIKNILSLTVNRNKIVLPPPNLSDQPDENASEILSDSNSLENTDYSNKYYYNFNFSGYEDSEKNKRTNILRKNNYLSYTIYQDRCSLGDKVDILSNIFNANNNNSMSNRSFALNSNQPIVFYPDRSESNFKLGNNLNLKFGAGQLIGTGELVEKRNCRYEIKEGVGPKCTNIAGPFSSREEVNYSSCPPSDENISCGPTSKYNDNGDKVWYLQKCESSSEEESSQIYCCGGGTECSKVVDSNADKSKLDYNINPTPSPIPTPDTDVTRYWFKDPWYNTDKNQWELRRCKETQKTCIDAEKTKCVGQDNMKDKDFHTVAQVQPRSELVFAPITFAAKYKDENNLTQLNDRTPIVDLAQKDTTSKLPLVLGTYSGKIDEYPDDENMEYSIILDNNVDGVNEIAEYEVIKKQYKHSILPDINLNHKYLIPLFLNARKINDNQAVINEFENPSVENLISTNNNGIDYQAYENKTVRILTGGGKLGFVEKISEVDEEYGNKILRYRFYPLKKDDPETTIYTVKLDKNGFMYDHGYGGFLAYIPNAGEATINLTAIIDTEEENIGEIRSNINLKNKIYGYSLEEIESVFSMCSGEPDQQQTEPEFVKKLSQEEFNTPGPDKGTEGWWCSTTGPKTPKEEEMNWWREGVHYIKAEQDNAEQNQKQESRGSVDTISFLDIVGLEEFIQKLQQNLAEIQSELQKKGINWDPNTGKVYLTLGIGEVKTDIPIIFEGGQLKIQAMIDQMVEDRINGLIQFINQEIVKNLQFNFSVGEGMGSVGFNIKYENKKFILGLLFEMVGEIGEGQYQIIVKANNGQVAGVFNFQIGQTESGGYKIVDVDDKFVQFLERELSSRAYLYFDLGQATNQEEILREYKTVFGPSHVRRYKSGILIDMAEMKIDKSIFDINADIPKARMGNIKFTNQYYPDYFGIDYSQDKEPNNHLTPGNLILNSFNLELPRGKVEYDASGYPKDNKLATEDVDIKYQFSNKNMTLDQEYLEKGKYDIKFGDQLIKPEIKIDTKKDITSLNWHIDRINREGSNSIYQFPVIDVVNEIKAIQINDLLNQNYNIASSKIIIEGNLVKNGQRKMSIKPITEPLFQWLYLPIKYYPTGYLYIKNSKTGKNQPIEAEKFKELLQNNTLIAGILNDNDKLIDNHVYEPITNNQAPYQTASFYLDDNTMQFLISPSLDKISKQLYLYMQIKLPFSDEKDNSAITTNLINNPNLEWVNKAQKYNNILESKNSLPITEAQFANLFFNEWGLNSYYPEDQFLFQIGDDFKGDKVFVSRLLTQDGDYISKQFNKQTVFSGAIEVKFSNKEIEERISQLGEDAVAIEFEDSSNTIHHSVTFGLLKNLSRGVINELEENIIVQEDIIEDKSQEQIDEDIDSQNNENGEPIVNDQMQDSREEVRNEEQQEGELKNCYDLRLEHNNDLETKRHSNFSEEELIKLQNQYVQEEQACYDQYQESTYTQDQLLKAADIITKLENSQASCEMQVANSDIKFMNDNANLIAQASNFYWAEVTDTTKAENLPDNWPLELRQKLINHQKDINSIQNQCQAEYLDLAGQLQNIKDGKDPATLEGFKQTYSTTVDYLLNQAKIDSLLNWMLGLNNEQGEEEIDYAQDILEQEQVLNQMNENYIPPPPESFNANDNRYQGELPVSEEEPIEPQPFIPPLITQPAEPREALTPDEQQMFTDALIFKCQLQDNQELLPTDQQRFDQISTYFKENEGTLRQIPDVMPKLSILDAIVFGSNLDYLACHIQAPIEENIIQPINNIIQPIIEIISPPQLPRDSLTPEEEQMFLDAKGIKCKLLANDPLTDEEQTRLDEITMYFNDNNQQLRQIPGVNLSIIDAIVFNGNLDYLACTTGQPAPEQPLPTQQQLQEQPINQLPPAQEPLPQPLQEHKDELTKEEKQMFTDAKTLKCKILNEKPLTEDDQQNLDNIITYFRDHDFMLRQIPEVMGKLSILDAVVHGGNLDYLACNPVTQAVDQVVNTIDQIIIQPIQENIIQPIVDFFSPPVQDSLTEEEITKLREAEIKLASIGSLYVNQEQLKNELTNLKYYFDQIEEEGQKKVDRLSGFFDPQLGHHREILKKLYEVNLDSIGSQQQSFNQLNNLTTQQVNNSTTQQLSNLTIEQWNNRTMEQFNNICHSERTERVEESLLSLRALLGRGDLSCHSGLDSESQITLDPSAFVYTEGNRSAQDDTIFNVILNAVANLNPFSFKKAKAADDNQNQETDQPSMYFTQLNSNTSEENAINSAIPGQTIVLNASNFTNSKNIQIYLDNTYLQDAKILGGGFGIKTKIPLDTKNGTHTIKLIGDSEGEYVFKDITINRPINSSWVWWVVGGVLLIVLMVFIIMNQKRKQKNIPI